MDVVNDYDPTDPKGDGTETTGATITKDGTTLKVVLDASVDSTSDVKDTGLFDLAEQLLEDNDILVTFPDGEAVRIAMGTNAVAAGSKLATKLGSMLSSLTAVPVEITVTVMNEESEAEVDFTVELSQADA